MKIKILADILVCKSLKEINKECFTIGSISKRIKKMEEYKDLQLGEKQIFSLDLIHSVIEKYLNKGILIYKTNEEKDKPKCSRLYEMKIPYDLMEKFVNKVRLLK